MSNIKGIIKQTRASILYILLKRLFKKPTCQNDESEIIDRLIQYHIIPPTFIELGFGGWEFNCAALTNSWEGLLVDGDPYNVMIARTILPRRIQVVKKWITLETLSEVHSYARDREIGILSIDLDGNDYWFLRDLLKVRPGIVIAEYNAIFGMRPITVPYDPNFDRTQFTVRNYYGASLKALHWLLDSHGYSLVDVGSSGINAFFVRNDLMGPHDRALQPEHSYREKTRWAGRPLYDKRNAELWEEIKDFPFIDVIALGHQPCN